MTQTPDTRTARTPGSQRPTEPLPASFKPLWRLMLALAALVAFVAGSAFIVDRMIYG
jgi:hypothetical protein